MSRDFDNKKAKDNLSKTYYQTKWNKEAYQGSEPKSVRNFHFFERLHYGVIDDLNNSIVPKKSELTMIGGVRVLNIVADHYALMKLNLQAASSKGVFSQAGEVFGNLTGVSAYEDPEVRYGEYLGTILRFYNETHIPNIIGKHSIASYEDYVKYFFELILNSYDQTPITMTRWNTSINSNILHTGLAFSYANIGYNDNQQKIDQIIDNPHFGYFSNLCVNMGFSMSNRNPHILVYDVSSPAGSSIRTRYGINTLSDFFNTFFIKTFTLDNNLLYNAINIYYNKYVGQNPHIRISEIKCYKVVTEFKPLNPIPYNYRPFTDFEELVMYSRIRNREEGNPFDSVKMTQIARKIKKLLSTLDKPSALSYINGTFRDQVWNKDFGFHDGLMKLTGRTTTDTRRVDIGNQPPGRNR